MGLRGVARASRLAWTLCRMLLATPAPGQVTGGSFGSSNWGGAAGSSSSSGSSGSSSRNDSGGRDERAGGDANEEHSSTHGTLMLLWCLTVALFVGCFHRTWTGVGVVLLALALMITLIGNVTTGRDLARARPGTPLAFDRDDGDWVEGTLVCVRPGGLYEVSGLRDRRIAVVRSRRVRALRTLPRRREPLAARTPAPGARWAGAAGPGAVEGGDLRGRAERATTPGALGGRRRAALARRAESEGTGVLLVAAARLLAARASALRGVHAEATAIDGQTFTAICEAARRVFGARVTAERGRYVVATIRGDEGGLREVSVAVTARAEEGAGFVVVTLVLAWRGRVDLLERAIAPGGLDALAASSLAPAEVEPYGLEAAWVPAVESDRMSSAELARVFPEIRWLEADARGSLGRITHDACRSVHAGELGECPTCGAPRVSS